MLVVPDASVRRIKYFTLEKGIRKRLPQTNNTENSAIGRLKMEHTNQSRMAVASGCPIVMIKAFSLTDALIFSTEAKNNVPVMGYTINVIRIAYRICICMCCWLCYL